ncbi:hypothetical protein [Alteromonas sp. 14N.309.X.WAT.G.H12]|uniref:hypothetical protein n=1 Tax=Alteromonas sp. 14N.309.X.WAT.G.H12 TaxID=3120824 RepID=UPI002FCF9FE2
MKIFLTSLLIGSISAAFIATTFNVDLIANSNHRFYTLDGYAATHPGVYIVEYNGTLDYIQQLKERVPADCEIGHDYLTSAMMSYGRVPFNEVIQRSLDDTIKQLCTR